MRPGPSPGSGITVGEACLGLGSSRLVPMHPQPHLLAPCPPGTCTRLPEQGSQSQPWSRASSGTWKHTLARRPDSETRGWTPTIYAPMPPRGDNDTSTSLRTTGLDQGPANHDSGAKCGPAVPANEALRGQSRPHTHVRCGERPAENRWPRGSWSSGGRWGPPSTQPAHWDRLSSLVVASALTGLEQWSEGPASADRHVGTPWEQSSRGS